ncbi:MAG: GFA family protein [Alphaproteobacteria bacterium]
MTEAYEGGCACGGVRYRMGGQPMFVHCCHCKRCQRLSGAAFGVNAPIETDRVAVLKGQPVPAPYMSEAGHRHTALRCQDCGVALWTHHPFFGPRIGLVTMGTLDAGNAFPPQIHCFTRFKLPWVALPPDVPAVEGGYDPAQVWPPESLARLAIARA